MRSDMHRRSGQAMAEFFIALLAMMIVVIAIVEFVPIFLKGIGLLKEVREEVGLRAIDSDLDAPAADRRDEFGFEVPDVFPDAKATSGLLWEKLRFPAANLACGESVPDIKPTDLRLSEPLLYYRNRAGSSIFISGITSFPIDEALEIAKRVFLHQDGKWEGPNPISTADTIIFTKGDAKAPAAVAAINAHATDAGILLTIVARTAGGEI